MQADPPKSNVQYNFKTAVFDFQKIKQQNQLPHKMFIKLQYLQNKILQRPIVIQQYKDLPQYQLQSLQQCDQNSQITLFVSIVKCLSGKQVIVYFNNTKSYIRKQQSFSTWTKCYISCDSTYLYVKKKAQKKTNYYQFKIKKLKVSKKYLQYKGKLCFGIMYQSKKYMMGFQQETACQRIFKTLRQLIKQNQPQKQSQISNPIINLNRPSNNAIKSQQQFKYDRGQRSQKFQSVIPSNQLLSNIPYSKQQLHSCIGPKSQPIQPQQKSPKNKQQKSRSILQFQPDEIQSPEPNMKQLKQQQIYEAIKQQVKKQNISNDTNYKLIKNLQLGRLLVFLGDQNLKQSKTKTSIILSIKQQKIDYAWILQQYVAMKSWNLQIQQCKITNKISNNSYKIYLQFKKYSFMSLTRWAIAILTGIIIQKKAYLLIRSCQQITEQQMKLGNYISTVKMNKFQQTIELCQKYQKDNKLLITILTTADFGGYCSKSDNFNMSLQILNSIPNFYNFLLTQAIAKDYEDSNKLP